MIRVQSQPIGSPRPSDLVNVSHEPKPIEGAGQKHLVLHILVAILVHNPDLPALSASLVLVIRPMLLANEDTVRAILLEQFFQELIFFGTTQFYKVLDALLRIGESCLSAIPCLSCFLQT